jgi:hypothetical protein
MNSVAAGNRILGIYLNKLVAWASARANISARRILVLASALVIGVMLLSSAVDTVWAAIELAY